MGTIEVRGNGVVGNGCLEWGPAFDEPVMLAVGCEEQINREGPKREDDIKNKTSEPSLI